LSHDAKHGELFFQRENSESDFNFCLFVLGGLHCVCVADGHTLTELLHPVPERSLSFTHSCYSGVCFPYNDVTQCFASIVRCIGEEIKLSQLFLETILLQNGCSTTLVYDVTHVVE